MSSNSSRPADAIDVDEDSDQKLLHVSEEYRRAKRNVLFWSSITVLLALAFDKHGDGLELSPIFGGLGFTQELLLILSLIVLSFMAVGYWRAEGHLINRNTHLTYGRTLSEAEQSVRNLIRQIRETESISLTAKESIIEEVEETRGKVLYTSQAVLKRLGEKTTDFEETVDAISSFPNQLMSEFSQKLRSDAVEWSGDRKRIGQIISNAQSSISKTQSNLKSFKSEIDRLIQHEMQGLATLKEMEFKPSKERITELESIDLGKLETLADGLNELSAEIEPRDRLLFLWFDRRLTYTALGIAVFFACWRLIAGQHLTWALVGIGL